MTDEAYSEAVRRMQAGNAKAFGELYAELAEPLYRFALSYLGQPADAEDAVQEALLSAFRNRHTLRKGTSFKSWLFTITANRCRDMLRAKTRVSPVDPEDPALAEGSYDQPFGEDAGALLSSLDATDREIVTLSVLGGYTGEEIGRSLGMKPATVRSRLSRALKKLREEWEEQ
ncbi:MAG: RNA polymerase sigma factor [Clostridia bacterium]|nr:RNA polymerase sigma factor [Clostridia bacterium]